MWVSSPSAELTLFRSVFLALSRGMRPDIGNKLSCFVALAPAVYGGPVLRSFPFSVMRRFKSRAMWKLVFGCEFVTVVVAVDGGKTGGWRDAGPRC